MPDTTGWLGQRRQFGIGLALGGGQPVIENPLRRTPIMSTAEDELAQIRARLVERYGPERAHRIADFTRNLFIFPNLILISNWHTIRTWYPLAPDYIEIDAWAALPRDESPALRQKRYENFISFLGPAGFGTPDDVSGLEGCQRGFATCRELEWSDISRCMGKEQPSSQDELQMRGFWRRWNAPASPSPISNGFLSKRRRSTTNGDWKNGSHCSPRMAAISYPRSTSRKAITARHCS